MQPRVFDPAITAQRTARGVVDVQNTGDQPIRFGIQIVVGEDRPLVGFLSQSEAQMVTSPLVPPGQTRQVTVFIPLPDEPGGKVFVVTINELDPAGRFVRELDTRRFPGLAQILSATAAAGGAGGRGAGDVRGIPTPAFRAGDIVLESPTGFDDVAQVAPIPGATIGPGFTSGQVVFRNIRGGTLPLDISWRALGPSRMFSTPTVAMEVTPVAGRNTLPITLRISPDAPPGQYSLELTVEFEGLRIASRAFPNVFEVLAAPEVAAPTVAPRVFDIDEELELGAPEAAAPAFRTGDIILDQARGFNNTTTGSLAFTRGDILFRNPRGGTNRIEVRERLLGPDRTPQTDFTTHVIDPVPGTNTVAVVQLLQATAPVGTYFLEAIVESNGRLITSRVFPNVFQVLAAPAPATAPAPAVAPAVAAVLPPAPTVAGRLSSGDVFATIPVPSTTRALRGQTVLLDFDIVNRTTIPAEVRVTMTMSDLRTSIPLADVTTQLSPRTPPFSGITPVQFRWNVGRGVRSGSYLARVEIFDQDRRVVSHTFQRVTSVVGDAPFTEELFFGPFDIIE